MEPILQIDSAGVQSTVQDRGRWGAQEQGVPICGTVVPHWMEIANALVGNEANTPGIEFQILGPSISVKEGPVKIAVCGDVSIEILTESNAGLQTRKVSAWRSFTLTPNDKLIVGAIKNTKGGFLAVSGGIKVSPFLGSASTYMRSFLGGFEGRSLRVGDQLTLGENAVERSCESDKLCPSPPILEQTPIRVVLGPQAEYFGEKAIKAFLETPFVISQNSDRMGARLEGEILSHKAEFGSEIISEGVVPGSIQVPGNGQPIILLNDGQTVGGYPKIATVVSADLHRVANALPGTQLHFAEMTAHEACLLARSEKEKIQKTIKSIVIAPADGYINLKALYETNLISGVVDMAAPTHFPGHLDI
jgi:5-oxoprolinase (ATP-hydrolysing) subunit C